MAKKYTQIGVSGYHFRIFDMSKIQNVHSHKKVDFLGIKIVGSGVLALCRVLPTTALMWSLSCTVLMM